MTEQMYKPDLETLAQLKIEATKNGTVPETDWRKNLSRTMASLIRKDPRSYRAYGPFWWLLKQTMLNNGITDFGTTIDAEWFEKADYGNPTLNLLAAWLYGDNAMDMGLIYSNVHTVSFTVEDEERGTYEDTREYVLVDDEVETLALR